MLQATVKIVKIAECFVSLQGEGPSVGCPAQFVRLQGCSVGCRWCDSKYTWSRQRGSVIDRSELKRHTTGLGRTDLLVITGGEPLENPFFPELLTWGAARWRRVEVETSGVCEPTPLPENANWNWSPKLSSATRRADETWQHYGAFEASGAYVCKVVVDDLADWEEAVGRLAELNVPRERVIMMPQGVRSEDVRERATWLASLCADHGYRLSPRLHIDLWGAKRGR